MLVKEETRAKAGLVYNVIETAILLFCVGLCTWNAKMVFSHEREMGEIRTQLNADEKSEDKRLTELESGGSRGLQSHVKSDDQRVADMTARIEKLESAVLALQSIPGELKANSVRLDSLREGQSRIEKALDEYIKRERKP